MRRTRITAAVVFLCVAVLLATSGALAASPESVKRHTEGGGLPFTGIDLNLIVAGALALVLIGVSLRRFARQRS